MFVPEGNFKFLVLLKQIGPLCTGGCKKLVYMAEILVILSVLREPARIFWNKRCSFDVTDFEKTLLVTLYFYCFLVGYIALAGLMNLLASGHTTIWQKKVSPTSFTTFVCCCLFAAYSSVSNSPHVRLIDF